MTEKELRYVVNAIRLIGENHLEWSKDYIYDKHTNEFKNINSPEDETIKVVDWFSLDD